MASIIALSIGCAFCIHRNSRDFSKSTNSLMVFIGGIKGITMFISFDLNMTKVKRLYGGIQALVKKGNIRLIILNETALVFNVFCTAEGTNAFKLNEECENKGGNYVIRISIFFVSQTAIGVHIFAWLYAAFNMFKGNLYPETDSIPYHADLPYDISTYKIPRIYWINVCEGCRRY